MTRALASTARTTATGVFVSQNLASARTGILQRKCDCGQHTGGGECEECKKKKSGDALLQRSAVNTARVDRVPPIVHEVLRSSGQPLDRATQEFFEPRFGHDFSGVRVHTDARAAESARAVHALAYTIGPNIIFGADEYVPNTLAGRKLIAHELTHVVQQAGAPVHRPIEIMPTDHWSEAAAEQAAAHEQCGDSASAANPAKAGANHSLSARALQRRAINNDAHVTCRATRPNAFDQLHAAEIEAIRILQVGAVFARRRAAAEQIVDIVGETQERHFFRDLLWRRFHVNYDIPRVRDAWLELISRRWDWLARAIGTYPIIYACGAPGTEPPGTCTDEPGRGHASSAPNGNDIQLCDSFWTTDEGAGQPAFRARAVLHEWFHLSGLGIFDCEARDTPINNTVCWDTFARELAGEATADEWAQCCPPPQKALPPFAGAGGRS